MKVVLDTNIIVSAFLVALGAPARILAALQARRLQLVLSAELFAEYERVLNRPDLVRCHKHTPEEITVRLTLVRSLAVNVDPENVPAVIADDPKDDMVLACAKAGAADFIVSGDPHLLGLGEYEGIHIVTPAAFVVLLDAEPPHT